MSKTIAHWADRNNAGVRSVMAKTKSKMWASFAAVCVLSLSACSTPPTKQQIGMATGAVVGGIVGSSVTFGSTAGTVAGAAGGALIGSEIAKQMK
jgi:osmotically inducible lipoprotein OsmB